MTTYRAGGAHGARKDGKTIAFTPGLISLGSKVDKNRGYFIAKDTGGKPKGYPTHVFIGMVAIDEARKPGTRRSAIETIA